LILLYLGFFPVPPDRPRASSEEITDRRLVCERKVGTRLLEAATHNISPGDDIQVILDQAQPGDTVLVSPGNYLGGLRIETDALTLRGVPEAGQRPVLDGAGQLQNGIVACADGITVEGLELRDFTGNGVMVQDVDRATIRDVFANHTGEYGILVLASRQLTVELSAASGASVSGIAVSQSRDVTVQGSEAFANVVGLEVDNSSNILLEENHAHDNSVGILLAVLPDQEIKESGRVVIRDNRVSDNDLENFAEEGQLAAALPAGTGILLLAADHSEVTANEVVGNRTAGVAVLGLRQFFPDRSTFDVGTEPEDNWIHANSYQDNGDDPAAALGLAGLPGADLIWDTAGASNLWSESSATRLPEVLPGPQLPEFVRRGLWRVLVIIGQLD
jgi:parallel beta-helix repeat protein